MWSEVLLSNDLQIDGTSERDGVKSKFASGDTRSDNEDLPQYLR